MWQAARCIVVRHDVGHCNPEAAATHTQGPYVHRNASYKSPSSTHCRLRTPGPRGAAGAADVAGQATYRPGSRRPSSRAGRIAPARRAERRPARGRCRRISPRRTCRRFVALASRRARLSKRCLSTLGTFREGGPPGIAYRTGPPNKGLTIRALGWCVLGGPLPSAPVAATGSIKVDTCYTGDSSCQVVLLGHPNLPPGRNLARCRVRASGLARSARRRQTGRVRSCAAARSPRRWGGRGRCDATETRAGEHCNVSRGSGPMLTATWRRRHGPTWSGPGSRPWGFGCCCGSGAGRPGSWPGRGGRYGGCDGRPAASGVPADGAAAARAPSVGFGAACFHCRPGPIGSAAPRTEGGRGRSP